MDKAYLPWTEGAFKVNCISPFIQTKVLEFDYEEHYPVVDYAGRNIAEVKKLTEEIFSKGPSRMYKLSKMFEQVLLKKDDYLKHYLEHSDIKLFMSFMKISYNEGLTLTP